MGPDPAIIPDGDGLRVLDVEPAAGDIGLVRGGEDGHVGTEHDAVANGHDGTVEDGEVEVGIEPFPDADVAAVVE